MIQNTKLARAVYWISNQISRIKVPTRLYALTASPNELGEYEDLDNMFTRRPGFTWMSCSWTWKLLALANKLDWDHFDHWALVHDRCDSTSCDKCGGQICGPNDDI